MLLASATQPPAGLSTKEWEAIRALVETDQYGMTPTAGAEAQSYEARNAEHALTARLSRRE